MPARTSLPGFVGSDGAQVPSLRSFPAAEGALALALADDASPFRARPIGEILVRTGALVPANLDRALDLQSHAAGVRLGAILVSERFVSEDVLASGLALQQGVLRVRPLPERIDPDLLDALGADFCLRHGVLPWRRAGPLTVVATSRPHRFEEVRPTLERVLGPVRMAIADENDITCSVLELRADWLVSRAESRPPVSMSVRRWSPWKIAALGLAMPLAIAVCAVLAPAAVLSALSAWVIGCLAAMTALRGAALVARLTQPLHAAALPDREPEVTPVISVLVPLLREADISAHLIDRLSELEYPPGRLEICLVCEADDAQTEAALERRGLGPQFRVIVVPKGEIRTKPRALNYALDFCRGDIVAIYDAEDAPEPDQLRRVAARFAAVPQDVVCLQGRLGFYNDDQNWLSRCFAIDYAAWFGVILPGLARLGFAIPLGGTGLFFRRAALEAAGRWDAHNVTEDADLGIRLARMGWRAEMLETLTREEANCRLAPWIRQRARWLKGYALTWAVHSAHPVGLWRDLGTRKFVGFQIMFLGTLSLFLLAPVLWSFWLLPFGLPHPLADGWSRPAVAALVVFFAASQLLDFAIAALGLTRNGDRWLVKWIPTTLLYFPLAAFASYRAFADAILRPYFWDKTAHGLSLRYITRRLSRRRRRSG
jgi:glycosyltransferase XagB